MNRIGQRASRSALAVVALGSAISLIAACGPAGAGAPTSAATSAPTTSPAPAATSAASGLLKLTAGSLPAGDYTTTDFEPTLHFTLGEGWGNNFPDDSDEIALNRGLDTSIIAMSRVSKVIDPTTHQAVPVPGDLLPWLAANPAFEWSGPTVPVEIAGLSGGMLEGKVSGTRPSDLFAYDTGNFRVVPGNSVVSYVLALDGPDLTITVMAEDATFASVVEATKTMLDTLEVATP